MNEESVEVDAQRFEELCSHYSGDILAQNRCKAVIFQDRVWTVTGISGGGKLTASATLHELVLPERYEGATGSYPCDTDGVFYKGQSVRARGRAFVMTGRQLLVLRKDEAPSMQLDLLGWREQRRSAARKNGKKQTARKRSAKKPPVRKTRGAKQAKPEKETPRTSKRR